MKGNRKAVEQKKAKKAKNTHDYTNRHWGHDFYISDVMEYGEQLLVGGWGKGIKAGHYLILPNGESSTRYKVKSIEYHRDPADMWSAEVTFAPRPRSASS